MSKRIIAAFMVALFVLGAALAAAPTWAHTTLGKQTGTMPFRTFDNDLNPQHAPGVTCYVWPGGGKDWWLTESSYYDISGEPPGYQSPWGTYPANALPTWYQLRANTYAPFGAILASDEVTQNVGDLIFAINFTKEGITSLQEEWYNYTNLVIYIPPEFEPVGADWAAGDTGNIATTLPIDDGDWFHVVKADVKDPFGPGWWIVHIPTNHMAIAFGDWDGDGSILDEGDDMWYYVRINGIAAPKIAGRYFFKMFINDSFPLVSTGDDNDGQIEKTITSAIPVENWPVLLVKGEIDPGIVEGSLFFSGWDTSLYGNPMPLPGRVRLVGTAMDPYTEELTGRHVEARGYTNASANGHYEVEGVAPGIYDVYASAAGYPETLVATGIKVLPGQSVHLDIALNPGAIIHGKIFAKHSFADVKWGAELPVTVEIYDSNEWPEPFPGAVWGDVDGTVPDNWLVWEQGTPTELVWTDKGYQPSSPAHLKSFSPINLTDAPYTSYVNGPQVLFEPAGPGSVGGGLLLDRDNIGLDNPAVDTWGSVTPRAVAFPWEGAPWLQNTGGWKGKDPAGVHNGVGPAQTWWTTPGSNTFEFKFGNKDKNGYGLYGCPTEFDGHVPQVFATWINGLTPGTYYMRVWINGFVQTDINGAYMDYVIHVAEQEWAGDIYVPIDVQLSGKINKTIHFQAGPGTLAGCKVGGPDPWRFVIVEARDAQGTLVAFNFTQVEKTDTYVTIELNGFGMAGPVIYDEWDSQESPWHWAPMRLVDPTGMKFFLYRYRHIRDYGLMPGTYKIYVYVRGFVQQEWEWASVSLSGRTTYISNHVYRGAGINVTVWSIDWQHPKIAREWKNPGWSITIDVTNRDTGKGVGVVRFWNSTTGNWEKPKQRKGEVSAPWEGWKQPPGGTFDPDTSYLKFNGSVYLERAGPDETIGAYTVDPEDEATTLWWTTVQWASGFLPWPGAYRDEDFNTVVALESGTYEFNVMTLGYVFKYPEKYTIYVAKGQQADTKLEVVIGVTFVINVTFKKEGLFEHIPYDMVVYLQVLDEDGNLVADAWPTWGNTRTGYALGKCNKTWSAVTDGYRVRTPDVWVGVDGYPNYEGTWTIKVWTWYTYMDAYKGVWHPVVPGLLLGFLGGDANHLGPYEMRTEVVIPNAPLSGSASVIFELDQRALISGQVLAFSESNELRTVSWASVTAVGAEVEQTVYTFDGRYEMFLPRGEYELTIEEWPGEAGHHTLVTSITAPDGGNVDFGALTMERSNIAIPEFPVALVPTMAALGASLYLLRRRR